MGTHPPHMLSLVRRTTWISIAIQLLTGIVVLYAIFSAYPPSKRLLHDLLILEGSVQLVELFFYLYIVRTLDSHMSLKSMAAKRYVDWVVTTPVMLITLAAYFTGETSIPFVEFWKANSSRLLSMMALNELMMVFGFLGELGFLPLSLAALAGFLAFALAFRVLYSFVNPTGRFVVIFWVVAVVWAVYGVAYMFPPHAKNITYNFLDLVAKNFFGIFLSVQLLMSVNSE